MRVLKTQFDFYRSPSPSQQSVSRSPKMGRRALQANGCSTSSPSPTRLHRAAADTVLARPSPMATRPSDLDVRQRRRRNDIVQVESRRVVTVVKDDGNATGYDRDDHGYDERYDGRRVGHRFTATSTSSTAAIDQMDSGNGRLDDTLYELQRLLSNGKLPQRFLEKLVSDDDITDRLLTEFEKLTTAAAAASASPALQATSADPSPSSRRSTADRRPAVGSPATGAVHLQHHQQQHRASSSSSTPEMTSGGRRSVRFDGTASSSAETPASGGRTTRRRRRDGRNNRSRSRSGGVRQRPLPPPPPPPTGDGAHDFDLDDDSAAEHGCCSTCSSSSGSELDDLSVYQLPARRPYGPGAGAAARISYVPNDAIAYAKQQAGHRSPGKRTVGQQPVHLQRPPPPPPSQQTMDDKNCAIQ